MLPLAILITLFVTTLGLWLIASGYRRQREFACAQCGYTLIGLNDAARCPECGGTLDGSSIRTPGETSTVWWKVVAGSLLLGPSLVALFAFTLAYLASRV